MEEGRERWLTEAILIQAGRSSLGSSLPPDKYSTQDVM